MNVQRSPPNKTVMSGSESDSGSISNASRHRRSSHQHYNITNRKRKERSEEHDCKKELQNFRNDIMKFMNDFAKTQNEKLSMIVGEISEVKDEIKTIKRSTEMFSQQFKDVTSEIDNIKANNALLKMELEKIVTDINGIKQSDLEEEQAPEITSSGKENLMIELRERYEREKNVIIVGIIEKSNSNKNTRMDYDNEEIDKILNTVMEGCPKPIKCHRLGKYIPGKNRPLKLYFDNSNISKQLLRNKPKLPDNIQMYYDQTPSQRQYLRLLKLEIDERTNKGEANLIIKYIKGVPKIIENKPIQKN